MRWPWQHRRGRHTAGREPTVPGNGHAARARLEAEQRKLEAAKRTSRAVDELAAAIHKALGVHR